eukprot:TRINITY_DN814_c0_g1_i3.p1 TRINITY_DN814_c0_g1~~TRINITY_DN814_c0_g1_i3.p1  ORF type:complete len:303 (-),score=68.59 TRINITY_DN814_c0_g1_i3:820-1728(-)
MEDDEKYMPTDVKRDAVGKTNLEPDGNAIILMEEVLETLKLLDYESKFCRVKNFPKLDCFYFCKPHTKPQQQFYYFTSLTSWLMGLNNHFYPPPAQFDDPNTTAASILLELRKMGISLDYPATKIKPGHGEPVATILKSLADKCNANVIRLGSIGHRPDGYADDITGDDDDAGAEIHDEVGDAFADDDDMFPGDSHKKTQELLQDDILISKVDSNAWMIELERVRPMLKLTIQSDTREWRTHLESMVANQDAIGKNMTDTTSGLEKLGGEIAKGVEKIQARENTLNTQFDSLVSRQYLISCA